MKMMKQWLLAGLSLLIGLMTGQAQTSGNYTPGKVAFTPVYEESFEGYSSEIARQMDVKLHQVVLQNGVGSYSGQYVISARILVNDKQAVPTTPVRYRVSLTVCLLAVDVDAQIILNELSIPLVGVDQNEDRAILRAIQSFKPADPRVRAFVQEASDKVVAAYNESLNQLLDQARSSMSGGHYDEALALLAQVPADVDRYEEVRGLADEVCRRDQSRKSAAAASAAEELQRERDREIQQQMALALESKAKSRDKAKLVNKVATFLFGSLHLA